MALFNFVDTVGPPVPASYLNALDLVRQAVSASVAGNVTVAAPSSGTALAVAALALGVAQTWSDGTRAAQLDFVAGQTQFGTTSAHGLDLLTANTVRLTFTNAGNATLNAPTAGVALTVNGVVGASTSASFTNGTVAVQVQSDASTTGAIGTSSNHALNLLTNNTVRLTFTNAGNATLNAPTAGIALTINSIGGNAGININGPVGNTGFLTLTDGQAGNRVWGLLNGFSSVGAFEIRDLTRGATPLSIGVGGNLTVSSPTTGMAITLSGVASQNSINVTGPANAAGLLITPSGVPGLTMNSAGTDYGMVSNMSSNVWALAHGTTPAATGTAVLQWNATGNVVILTPSSGDTLTVAPSPANGGLIATNAALTNNAGGSVGTLTNAPAAGNPTKWIKINDNGTIRSIPAW